MAENTLATQAKPTKAVRLVFTFDGDDVHLVSQQSVDMTLPPSDPIEGSSGQKGFWYELRDSQDRTLYRRIMHHPMREDVEVFSDDPAQHSVARHPAPKRNGVFIALVPDTEEGQTVTVTGSPTQIAVAHQPATEVARIALKK